MQRKARESIETYHQERNVSIQEAKTAIEGNCTRYFMELLRKRNKVAYSHSLAKLIDQHNYVIFTRTNDFRNFLNREFENGEITATERRRLLENLRQSA